MAHRRRFWLSAILIFLTCNLAVILAQEGGDDAPAPDPAEPTIDAPATAAPVLDPGAGEPAAEDDADVGQAPGFRQIVFGGGIINTLIWCLIFLASFATMAFIVDGALTVGREKLVPAHVVEGVRMSLDDGDLGTAMSICEQNPGPLSSVLISGFTNISEGFEVVQESVSASTDLENEKLMQRINYLNLCGQVAPMLGLLGTVTGMVKAFGGLATGEAGPLRDQMLAQSISTALWTTVSGLLISVPALLAFTIFKNLATQILLESEATVLDLIKILRGAEIEEDDGEYEEEEEGEEEE